ncbi:MAG: DUF4249 domain-containing protein [Cyclobacteriaceae bacterium]|nr:DUF4249 domain-containing protein [Cyclobacteriaceae bacterium]
MKILKKPIGIFTISWLLTIACDDIVQIEIPANENLIVVEGWVTDLPGPQSITITQSSPFSSTEPVQTIHDASVTVYNQFNEAHPYYYQNKGTYQSLPGFQGNPNDVYRVEIILANGDTLLSSPEFLIEVSPIDSLGYNWYLRERTEPPRIYEQVYYPVAFASDPPDQKNYYEWKVYKNDSLFTGIEKLTLIDDKLFNGNSYQNDFRLFDFQKKDTIRIEIKSLSERAFDFLTAFKFQVTSLGTRTGTSPSPLKGNLINKNAPHIRVLGYFGATSIKSEETIIQP